MSVEIENHRIRLLQEMQGQLERTHTRLEDLSDRFTDLTQRIDGNTLVFNLVAGVVHDHEDRIGSLEGARP